MNRGRVKAITAAYAQSFALLQDQPDAHAATAGRRHAEHVVIERGGAGRLALLRAIARQVVGGDETVVLLHEGSQLVRDAAAVEAVAGRNFLERARQVRLHKAIAGPPLAAVRMAEDAAELGKFWRIVRLRII